MLALRTSHRVQAAFDYQYRHDAIGHRLHVVFALVWCFFLAWPTTWVELAALPLYAFGLIRVLNVWRTWPSVLLSPPLILLYAWAAWNLLSLAWSADPRQGLEELGRLRFAAVVWMLWPVIDRRTWFIWTVAAGFLAGNLVQAAHLAGAWLDIPALQWGRLPDRYSAWWDPVVGGTLLVGALGLHLPAALMGRGRERLVAAAGAAATALAVLATGTRGAWIAAAALIALASAVALIRALRAGRTPSRRASLFALGALALVLLAGGLLVGPSVARRATEAWTEVTAALRGDYSSYTGARVLMNRLAIKAWAQHPVRGVGAGGYRDWVDREIDSWPTDGPRPPSHAHAHSTPLHVAATTGTVGLLIAAAFLAVTLAGALARDQLSPQWEPRALGSYAAGPAFALIGLALAGLFDVIHVNAQTAALLFTLVALSILPRPRPPQAALPA